MSYSNISQKYQSLRLFALLSSCLVVLGCARSVNTEPSSIIGEEASRLISNTDLSAVSVAFVAQGSVDTFHYGKFPDGSVPSDSTFYDIGSITKTHVGLILAKAVADELVDLDSPVSQYLSAIDRNALEYEKTAITVRHLATHLSGLPVDLSCNDINLSAQARLSCFIAYDDEDLLKDLNKYVLREKPGSQYRYSNTGIRLIGVILEDLYNAPMEVLLDRFVFKRTGQTETVEKLSALEHSKWRRGIHESGIPTPDSSNYFNAAGGLKSTAPDMGKYLSYYLNSGDELAKSALTLLAGKSDGLGRAYIWNTFRLDSEGQYYHGGGTFGTSAWVSIYPREKLGIFMVTPFASSTTQEKLNIAANQIIKRYRQEVK